MRLFEGDCLSVLKGLPDDSVDSIVTDPPYGLSFMGKKWDYDVPSVEVWRECLRVLKPGGHLLAFAGSRTYHRLVINVEDAGFEIRDQIMWVYGSGFPKSHNIGHKAEEWQGWGSALKPSHEPIVVARKPLIGTLVANVLEHGTGGLNIDACRAEGGRFPANFIHDGSDEVVSLFPESNGGAAPARTLTPAGRHYEGGWGNMTRESRIEYGNGSAARFFYCAKASKSERNAGLEAFEDKKSQHNAGGIGRKVSVEKRLEQGKENAPMMKNIHPTVKPVDLMKYLCRLVTPPEGVVLDPFMGSGTTGIAAKVEGFNFIGIEMDREYLAIAEARIGYWVEEAEATYKTLHNWL